METEVKIKIFQQVVVDLDSKNHKEEYTFKVCVNGDNSKEQFSFDIKTFKKRDKKNDIEKIVDCVYQYLDATLK